jgi:hypothetical protein
MGFPEKIPNVELGEEELCSSIQSTCLKLAPTKAYINSKLGMFPPETQEYKTKHEQKEKNPGFSSFFTLKLYSEMHFKANIEEIHEARKKLTF